MNIKLNLNQFQQLDGSYLSPRNGKTYKSLKAFRSHWSYNPKSYVSCRKNCENSMREKTPCQYCGDDYTKNGISRHEGNCYLNPKNIILCSVCNEPIKNKKTKGTCSKSCSNIAFRSGENHWMREQGIIGKSPNSVGGYRRICFDHHKKECVVCGEDKIVEVHHYDHDHENNDPKNLVPVCPTHHRYIHSRYVGEVIPIIDAWRKRQSVL